MASVSARVGYHEVGRVEKSEFPSECDSASVAASPSLKVSLHSLMGMVVQQPRGNAGVLAFGAFGC
jgi:hypothetical protein